MEVKGLQEIPIDWLKLPGDFKDRLERPSVHDLADSFKRVGQMHEPWVRDSTHELIAGADRVAGHIKNGETHVLCKIVECSDDEVKELRLTENVRRRHNEKRWLEDQEALLNYYAAKVAEERDKLFVPKEKKTAKGHARDRVAKARGIKPDSVRRAEHRLKLEREAKALEDTRREAQGNGEIAPPPAVSPIDDMGFDLPIDWLAEVGKVKDLIIASVNKAQFAANLLSQIANQQLPFVPQALQTLRDQAVTLTADLKASVPRSLCPYCKLQPEILKKCTACGTMGYITEGQMNRIPEELKRADQVFLDGKVQALEFGDAPENGAPLEDW